MEVCINELFSIEVGVISNKLNINIFPRSIERIKTIRKCYANALDKLKQIETEEMALLEEKKRSIEIMIKTIEQEKGIH